MVMLAYAMVPDASAQQALWSGAQVANSLPGLARIHRNHIRAPLNGFLLVKEICPFLP